MAVVIALTGFMGSGKSAVGRQAAAKLGWRFVDLDERVTANSRQAVADIFAAEGEEGFRSRELRELKAVLQEAEAGGDVIVSLGGGTLTQEAAVRALKDEGRSIRAYVVYLDTPVDVCWDRVGRDRSRPLAESRASFDELAERREGTYRAVSDFVIEAEARTVDQLAEEVAAMGAALAEHAQ
ncbi:MAG: hypothetical protein Kow00129_13160 [Thermoleophilia bacterium]